MESEVFERMARQEARHWWFCARRRIVKAVLDKYRPSRDALQILDAGCGTGGNLALLSEYGELSAFEVNRTACDVARSKGFAVEEGYLPDGIPFPGRQFDLIVLLDVLEHVEADQPSLENLLERLKPGGQLILTVPAFSFLWSAHDDHHQHYRRYRRSRLMRQATLAGFQVRRLSYYNFWLFPPVVLIRLFKKASHSQRSDELSVPPFIFNSLLKIIYSSERFLLPWMSFPFGVSLLAVLERPRN